MHIQFDFHISNLFIGVGGERDFCFWDRMETELRNSKQRVNPGMDTVFCMGIVVGPVCLLSQYALDHVAMHVGEAALETVVVVGESLVVEAQ